jgi:hypothetical protein
MTLAIFKFINRYDSSKSKFNTWVQNALFPMLKDPDKFFGTKFDTQHKGKMVDINKPI